MNKIRFKNRAAIYKKRMTFSILLSVLLAFLLTTIFVKNLSSNLLDYAAKSVKKENLIILKNAFSEGLDSSIDIDDLIQVTKNSKEEITEVSFDMKKSSKLLSNVTSYMNEYLSDYNYLGYRIDIPVGIFIKNPLFVQIGPKIPVKVELSDIALGNVRTAVKPFGINSALIEVYLDIFVRTTILYPFETMEADSEFSSLVTSKIISGTVPNFFGGTIDSKSDTINVPLR